MSIYETLYKCTDSLANAYESSWSGWNTQKNNNKLLFNIEMQRKLISWLFHTVSYEIALSKFPYINI